MEFIKSTDQGFAVPQGALVTLVPSSPGASARAMVATSGVAGGPWHVSGVPQVIGPFPCNVVIVVEVLGGVFGVEVDVQRTGPCEPPAPPVTVVDNLTTPSPTSALSANQGVVLKGE